MLFFVLGIVIIRRVIGLFYMFLIFGFVVAVIVIGYILWFTSVMFF